MELLHNTPTMRTCLSGTSIRPVRWILAAALALTTSVPARSDMGVERTMRELQARYHYFWEVHKVQTYFGYAPNWEPYLAWTPGYGGVAPQYPPDGYYGDLSRDPDLGVIVIQKALDQFTSTKIYERFINIDSPILDGKSMNEVDALKFKPDDFPDLRDHDAWITVDRTNYGVVNKALWEALRRFRYALLVAEGAALNAKTGLVEPGFLTKSGYGTDENGEEGCATAAAKIPPDWLSCETTFVSAQQAPGAYRVKVVEGWSFGSGGVATSHAQLMTDARGFHNSKAYFHVACLPLSGLGGDTGMPGPTSPLDDSGTLRKFAEGNGGDFIYSPEVPIAEPKPACPPQYPLLKDGYTRGWYVSDMCTVMDITFVPEIDGVDPCCSDCPPGTSTIKAGSLHAYFSLGSTLHGKNAGHVLLHAEGAAHDLADPKWLRYNVYPTDGSFPAITTTDCYGTLRQIITHEVVLNVDYDSQNPDKYSLVFYNPSNLAGDTEAIAGGTRRVVNGNPFKTATIEGIKEPNSNGLITEVHVTEVSADSVKEHIFTHGVALGGLAGWAYQRPDDLGHEMRMSNDESPSNEEFTIMDADFTTRYFERTVREMKPWGEEIIERQVGQTSPLVTSWGFHEDPLDGDNYGHVKTIIHPGGHWERFPKYDRWGRVRKHVEQWLDNDQRTADSANRVTTYIYAPDLITIREEVLGQLVAKRYVRFDGPGGYRADEVVTLPDDANPQNETRLITQSWRAMNERDGSTFGMTTKTIRPDGTGSRTVVATGNFPVNPDDPQGESVQGMRVTAEAGVWSGTILEVNSTDEAVRDGAGHPVWRTRRELDDNDSRKPVQVTVSKELYDDLDTYGRPQKVSSLALDANNQPLVQETHHGCCGVQYRTGRDGTRTDYLIDGLRRQYGRTTDGITVWSSLDAAGNARRTCRQHTGETQLLEAADYDDTGRKTRSSDALGNDTYYSLDFAPFIGSSPVVSHRITTVRNPDASTVINTYYADGHLFERGGTAAFPVRHEYGVEWDEDAAITARVSQEIRVGDNGEVTEWVRTYRDMAGRVYKRVFSDEGDQAQGGTEMMHYNAVGQLEKQVDADGVITLFEYNDLGEQEYTILDCDGTAGYQPSGTDRVTRVVRSVLSAAHSGHDVAVHRTETYVWEDEGSAGVLLQRVDQSVDGLQSWTEFHWKDASGGLVITTTESRTEYDPVNQRIVETREAPDGTKTVTVTKSGKQVSVTRLGNADQPVMGMRSEYDHFGRLWQIVDARNGATEYGYDLANRQTTVTTPAPGDGSGRQVTEQFLDGMGRPWAVLLPDGEVRMNEYYSTGLLKLSYGARTYPVRYEYDSQGRLKKMTTWKDFDVLPDHLQSTRAAETTWDYDSGRGWLRQKRDASNKGPDYTYTAGGRLKTRTWARNHGGGSPIVTTYTYGFDDEPPTSNAHGDLVGISYNDSVTPAVTRSYDRQGRLHTVTRGDLTTTLSYNRAGVPTGESYNAGSLAGLSVARTFDASLRLDTLTAKHGADALQTADYAYDPTGRLWKVTSDADVVEYAYHANSDLVSTLAFKQNGNATQLVTTRKYDQLNRLRSVSSNPTGASLPLSHAYAYNAASQRTRMELADGSYWVYHYDQLGQVISGCRFWADGTPVAGQQFKYAFDDIGNRTTTGGRESAVSSYTVNYLNQYESRTVAGAVDVLGSANPNASVTVDAVPTARHGEYFHRVLPVDNRGLNGEKYTTISVAASQGTRQASQTTQAFVPPATEEFVHDYDGNLRRDGRWVYEWDAENRLIEMRRDYAAPAGAQLKLTFEYDWQGRRIRKTVYQGDGQAPPNWTKQRDTVFLYDGWNLVAELETNGQTPSGFTEIRTYVWGNDLSGSMQGAGGVGGLLKVNDAAAGGSAFVAYDGNGNVMALVDATDGTVSARYEYGPFGEPLRTTGPHAVNPFRFSTKYCDAESGLYYYGYRYYDPITGRWLSRDPIGEQGGTSLYGFLRNDALLHADSLGMFSMERHAQITAWAYSHSGKSDTCACPHSVFFESLLRGSIAPDLAVDYPGSTSIPHAWITDAYNGYDLFSEEFLPFRAARGFRNVLGDIGSWLVPDGFENWWENDPLTSTALQLGNRLSPTGYPGALYKTHYGANSWQHAMSTVGQSAQDVHQKLVDGALKQILDYRKTMRSGDCDEAAFALGKALHYLQDSYSESHAKRGQGGIQLFQSYALQNATAHEEADVVSLSSASASSAIGASSAFITMATNMKLSDGELRTSLQNMFFQLAPGAKAGQTLPLYARRQAWEWLPTLSKE